jgi:hypothetical protein
VPGAARSLTPPTTEPRPSQAGHTASSGWPEPRRRRPQLLRVRLATRVDRSGPAYSSLPLGSALELTHVPTFRSGDGTPPRGNISIRLGGVVLVLEGREAYEALQRAWAEAQALVDEALPQLPPPPYKPR